MTADAGAARVDSWLWAVRVFKTRSAATAACRAGHVRIGGATVKAAQLVRPGDEIRVRRDGFDRILVVREPLVKRVGAALVPAAMEDRTPPREVEPAFGLRDRGAGRPTKRERRDLDRFFGH